MEKRTELNTIGEFGLIDNIAVLLTPQRADTIQGVGDDAAVIDNGTDNFTLVSTEMFAEGTHFDLSYVPLKHLGYKVVSAGISDIIAMNGMPTHITIGIGLSNRFSVEAIEEFYEGVRLACRAYNVDIVGGDTTTNRSGLTLAVTVIGVVNKHRITYRSGASNHDILCVTGDFGGAYLGLQSLEREKQVFLQDPEMQPQLIGKDYILQRQLRPEARLDIVQLLQEIGIVPSAMIDVSDGLASEILHLCKASGVGVRVFEERLPIHDQSYLAATDLQISPITAAMNGGEDYELLFSVKQADYEKIQDKVDIQAIGFFTADIGIHEIVSKNDTIYPIQAQGW